MVWQTKLFLVPQILLLISATHQSDLAFSSWEAQLEKSMLRSLTLTASLVFLRLRWYTYIQLLMYQGHM